MTFNAEDAEVAERAENSLDKILCVLGGYSANSAWSLILV